MLKVTARAYLKIFFFQIHVYGGVSEEGINKQFKLGEISDLDVYLKY